MKTTRIGVVGCGLMGFENMERWLAKSSTTGFVFPVIVDPSESARTKMLGLYTKAGLQAPTILDDASPEACTRMARDFNLDMAYIASPTGFHAQQAIAFMESGIDVLLEKPAAPTVAEIRQIAETERKTGKKLSIGFNGSLSRGIRLLSALVAGDTKSFQAHLALLKAEDPVKAADMARLNARDFTAPHHVAGLIWENWINRYLNSWKYKEGFIMDCGIHMLNAVYDVMSSQAQSVRADLAQDASDTGNVTGVLARGVPFRLSFLGDMQEQVCESRVRVRFESGAVVEFDIWGKWFKIQDAQGNALDWKNGVSFDPLGMFMAYREGRIENPSPITRSLDIAEFMDAISASRKRSPSKGSVSQAA